METHATHARARYPHTRAAGARLIRLHHQRCARQDPLVRVHGRAYRPREDEGRTAHRCRVKGADVPADGLAHDVEAVEGLVDGARGVNLEWVT